MSRRIGWICLVFAAFSLLLAETSEAQLFRSGPLLRPGQFAQRGLRFLGHGNGPGYHTRNPGPNVDYYNAWRPSNSFLISKSPQFLSRYGNELHRTPIEILQMGSQTWSAQSPYGHQQPSQYSGGAASVQADFVPATRQVDPVDPDTDSDLDDEDDEGFGQLDETDGEDDAFDDRFDDEADAMQDVDGEESGAADTDDEVGGFNSLKNSLGLPPIHRPASFPVLGK